jgi:hypothetical protein
VLWRNDGADSGAGPPRRAGARIALIAALVVIGIQGAVALAVLTRSREAPLVSTVPVSSGDRSPDLMCEGVKLHYGIHGTDCRSLPIVTPSGALGPANTGGPAGGTDWVQAYPGSNVWIPDYQISGRLLVVPTGSNQPPPPGYEMIGRAPDGATFYWRADSDTQ